MLRDLILRGVAAKSQEPFPINHKGHCVGECLADLVVEGQMIVELKCVEANGAASSKTKLCYYFLGFIRVHSCSYVAIPVYSGRANKYVVKFSRSFSESL